MRLLLISIFLSLIIFSCRNHTHGIITIGEYTFNFPSDFRLIGENGIDSYGGKIIGNKLWLGFNYGYYADPIIQTPQEFVETGGGGWKLDAYSWFVKPKSGYTSHDVGKVQLLTTRSLQTKTDSSKFKGADLIAVCKFDSATFDYGITLPDKIKQHTFIIDTISSCYRKIVIAKDPKKGYTGIYIKNLHPYSEGMYVALSMATSDLTKAQQDSIAKIFLNVKIAHK